MKFKLLKTLSFVLVTFFLVLSCVCLKRNVYAAPIERSSLGLDENLSDQSTNNYSEFDDIVVVEIESSVSSNYGDSEEWFKGLYYYMITRMGFADLPFNYVVTWDGDIYEAKNGSFGVNPIVDWQNSEVESSSLVVAYFGNNRGLSSFGSQSLEELISNLVGFYDIDPQDVVGGSIYLASKTEEVELSKLLINSPQDSWQASVNLVTDSINKSSDYWVSEYNAEIKSVSVPDEPEAGSNVEVTVVAQNNGNLPWFNDGSSSVLVATSDPRDRNSSLAVSDDWASLSRVVGAVESVVLPGEDAHFTFNVKTSLIPRTYSEKFELMKLPGSWIDNSEIVLNFQTKSSGQSLVEIRSTETGFLNLRNCPGTGCDEIGRVVPGDVLINLGEDNGWYKVQLDSGIEGWVYGRYVTELQ